MSLSGGSKKKNSFLSRLLLTYLVAALIPLFCIIGILFHLKWDAGKKEMQKTADYTAELLSVQLESVWNTMSFISLDIVSHDKFVSAAVGLTYEDASSYEKARCYNTLVAAISSYPYVSSSYRVVFFNDKGYFMTNERYNRPYDYTYRLPEGCLEQYGWIDTARSNYGKEILLPVSAGVLPGTDTEGFSLVRSVRDPGSVVGFLAVQLTGDSLRQLLNVGELYDIDIMISRGSDVIYRSEGFPLGSRGHESQSFSLDSSAESLVFPSGSSGAGENRSSALGWAESLPGGIDGLLENLSRDYLVSSVRQKDSGIQVTAVISMAAVLKLQRDDFVLIGLIAVFVTLMTLIMICVFARRMSAPLILFTKKMKDTTVRNLAEDSDDRSKAPFHEVQLLYDEFSRMRGRLEVMIENEIALTALQARERLHYLQSQINPHFLYNTLNMIGIMGAETGDMRIYNSCQMLSAVLKYAVTDKESDSATFGEEFENTEMYLNLMKLRFEDRLEFRLECAPDLRQCRTLRITLQPFVENIFEHAFDAGHTRLAVSVKGIVTNDKWNIVIEDDGAGMPEEKLGKMRQELEDGIRGISFSENPENPVQEEIHIGIRNTLIRMSLFYGDSFRYSVDNVSSGGFRVTLEGSRQEKTEEVRE